MPEQVTGSQSLVRALEAVGVDTVFGIPGGAILPAYDPLFDSQQVRHILVRHEQGAGHAAEGYAAATGRVGVCMATSGPGATNLVTPIADAYMDSVPIVAITGQVPSAAIGTDAFQEADIRGITMPITKHNYLVTDPADIPRTIAEAFHIASTGRPGPVLVDISKDALQASTSFSWPVELDLPGYRPVTKPHGKQIREAARLLVESKRPVLYVGGGRDPRPRRGRAARPRRADRRTRRHDADGARRLPRQPPAAPRDARHARQRRRGDRPAEGRPAREPRRPLRRPGDRAAVHLRPDAKVVHADIDPAEISKNRTADVPIVGDCRETIAELIVAVPGRARRRAPCRT
jgi:acetolactate synthase-1/2/3 large subunit